jgi:hypothetical protein
MTISRSYADRGIDQRFRAVHPRAVRSERHQRHLELACLQAEKGAAYIDVNIGRARRLYGRGVKNSSSASPAPFHRHAGSVYRPGGLEAYDPRRPESKPILNSISEARLHMFDLYQSSRSSPFAHHRGMDTGREMVMNKTAEQSRHRTFSAAIARNRLALSA